MNDQNDKFEYWLKGAMPRMSDDEREALWASIAFRLPSYAAKVSKRVRAVVAGAVAFGLFSSGILTVYASDAAVPGDILYPVDRALEEARVVVTPTEERKERIRVAQAYERLEEVRIVLERNSMKDEDGTRYPHGDAFLDVIGTSTIVSGDRDRAAASGERTEKDGRGEKREENDTPTSVGRASSTSEKSTVDQREEQVIEQTIVDLKRAKDSVRREDRKEEIERVVRKIEEVKADRAMQRQRVKEERQQKLEEERSRRDSTNQGSKDSEQRSTREIGNVRTTVSVSLPQGYLTPASEGVVRDPSSTASPAQIEDGKDPTRETKVTEDSGTSNIQDPSRGDDDSSVPSGD